MRDGRPHPGRRCVLLLSRGELEGIALAGKRSLRLAASLKLMRRAQNGYSEISDVCREGNAGLTCDRGEVGK
jgi:hypothetical protein